jgi:hypothetical protein
MSKELELEVINPEEVTVETTVETDAEEKEKPKGAVLPKKPPM